MQSTTYRNYWVDNLRSFITVLVLAHHAALAYTTFAYFDKSTYINSTHPIVDNTRWIGMDVFVNFNDIFFMSLMFLISGLFFFNGLKKKGAARLLLDRGKRLGIPFLIAEAFIIPIAYIPSYYLINHQFSLGSFANDYLVHQQWPVGPPWFIWLLLAFNGLSALLPQSWCINAADRLMKAAYRPFRFLMICFIFTAVALIPLSLWIGQYTWTGFGPFDFQLNRLIFYFVFFLLGSVLGTVRWEDYLFSNNRLLGKTTLFWVILSLVFYGMIELITFRGNGEMARWHVPAVVATFIFLVFFVATSIITCFAFIIIFRNFQNKISAIWKSLSANAYGIYLLHYIFIIWLQYALLNIQFACNI